MGPQYQPEQLLRLRNSPLVCKPATLPPVEEWMGAPPEQTQKRAVASSSKINGGSFGNDGQTRPSLIETRHLSRAPGNAPSDIVLGPPKTAFASASALKSPARTLDSPSRSAFGNFGGDTPRSDYFGQKGRFNGDRDNKKDLISLKNIKNDAEAWSGPRSARNFSSEEDNPSKKYDDREVSEDLGEGRDSRKHAYRDHTRGDEFRRNGANRGVKPWSRDDETFGSQRDANVESIRNREWRDSERGVRRGDKDWNKNTRNEQDPEWMVEEKSDQRKEKHTTQDIEQWKAQMRAQTKGLQDDVGSGDSSHTRSASGSVVSKNKVDTPLTFDKGADSFFNFFDKPMASTSRLNDHSLDEFVKPEVPRQGMPKSSRFTGFFGPQSVSTPTMHDAPAVTCDNADEMPTAEESAIHTYNVVFDEAVNDDKAGFERMLQMLRNPRPSEVENGPRAPAPRGQNEQQFAHTPQSPTIHSPRSQKTHGLENLLGTQSSREFPPVNPDTEFLLNLLRKDDGWQTSFPGLSKVSGNSAPGILPHPNVMAQMQSQHHLDDNIQGHFFEDSIPDSSRPVDKLNPTTSAARHQRQTAPFDDQDESNHSRPPFSIGNPNVPPGLQRPPGFDHPVPPASYPGLMPPGQSQRGPMAPPPGFPTPSRNPNPGHFPPGLGPGMVNLNLGPDRGPPFSVGPGGLGGPFMTGPPPFPSHGNPSFPMMGGGSTPFTNGPIVRPPMDIFSDFGASGGGVGRGGSGVPPSGHFTRPE